MVSIIMPSYNSAEFIAGSIESILAQSYHNWELIVVDDCSTDTTCDIVEGYVSGDERVKLIRLSENMGVAVARNRAMNHATGRYMAFCDSDDRWMPHKLERQMDIMAREDAKVCYSSYYTCNRVGKLLNVVVARNSLNFERMVNCDYMGTLTFIYDTQRIGRIEFPIMNKRQDWALKLLVMQRVKRACGIKEPLAYYSVREDSISSGKFGLIKYNISVYHNVLNYSLIMAWLVFLFRFMPSYIIKRTIFIERI